MAGAAFAEAGRGRQPERLNQPSAPQLNTMAAAVAHQLPVDIFPAIAGHDIGDFPGRAERNPVIVRSHVETTPVIQAKDAVDRTSGPVRNHHAIVIGAGVGIIPVYLVQPKAEWVSRLRFGQLDENANG